MNTLIVAGSVVLVAILGSIYLKYQEKKMRTKLFTIGRATIALPILFLSKCLEIREIMFTFAE